MYLNATLGGLLELDSATSNGTDRLSHKFDINLCGIFFELHQHLLDVTLGCEHNHNLELFHLYVNRVVVFTEEHLHFVLEDFRSLLNDQVDVTKSHVLNFGLFR